MRSGEGPSEGRAWVNSQSPKSAGKASLAAAIDCQA